MDQLDILKKDWDTQNVSYPKYSKDQLKSMLAHKSTSIVKWLLIIAIIEFIIMTGINFLPGMGKYQDESIRIMGEFLYYGSFVLHYIVIGYFIFLFYKNYKLIQSTQPTRGLMKNILRTRKTMKWYIWYNLGYIFVFGIIASILLLFKDPKMVELLQTDAVADHQVMFYTIYILFTILLFGVIISVFYGIYSLIYGILLRRLRFNYEELKRMEV